MTATDLEPQLPSLSSSDTESTRSAKPKTRKALSQRLSEELDVSLAYAPMLLCCFISGLTDATIYNDYETFVSMQTGNTIFIALATAKHNTNPLGWARSLTSICCFAAGAFAFARVYILFGGRSRGTLMASFAFQFICVAVAAALIDRPHSLPPADGLDFHEFISIALLSFQAAGQIVSSRGLGVNELPTVVITSMVCDLMSDPMLFAFSCNRKRNCRATAFVLMLLGAIVGGAISNASGSARASLWTVAGIKLALAVVWSIWRSKDPKSKHKTIV